jgi:hypothetical protein
LLRLKIVDSFVPILLPKSFGIHLDILPPLL